MIEAENDSALVDAIRCGLAALADPARAPQMRAYMRSAMPCLGVRVPQVRALVRTVAGERGLPDVEYLQRCVRELWFRAQYREQRYAATALTAVPSARRLRTPQLITLYEELIVSGAWWDHVDEISHRVGDLLLTFRPEITPVVHSWQRVGDPWLRRASVICQLGARERTDRALLSDAILANADDRGFFLRKAIGWALRDYAHTDPDWVRAFVAQHELSPLSRREALKHL